MNNDVELSVDASSVNLLYNIDYSREYEFLSGNIPTGTIYRKLIRLTHGCDFPISVDSSELVLRFPESDHAAMEFDTMTITS